MSCRITKKEHNCECKTNLITRKNQLKKKNNNDLLDAKFTYMTRIISMKLEHFFR